MKNIRRRWQSIHNLATPTILKLVLGNSRVRFPLLLNEDSNGDNIYHNTWFYGKLKKYIKIYRNNIYSIYNVYGTQKITTEFDLKIYLWEFSKFSSIWLYHFYIAIIIAECHWDLSPPFTHKRKCKSCVKFCWMDIYLIHLLLWDIIYDW